MDFNKALRLMKLGYKVVASSGGGPYGKLHYSWCPGRQNVINSLSGPWSPDNLQYQLNNPANHIWRATQ